MKRPVILVVTVAVLVAAVSFVWVEVRRDREFRRLIAVGDAELADGQTLLAIEAFSGAVVLKPDSMLARLKRGDTYRRRGELTNALRDLRQAAELDPTAPQPLERLGDVNSALERHARAAEHYEHYLQLDDRAAHVLYKLAAARFRNSQPVEAIEPLLAAVALDDRLVEAHHLLGMSLRVQNRYEEALRALQRAVAINPAFVAAHEELALLYDELGRSRDHIEQLETLAALEPGRPERLVAVAVTYARIGRTDAATLTLRRAAERYPDAAVVNMALGRVWLHAAEARHDRAAVARALHALQPLAARADATSEALTLYGRALLLSGQAARAEGALRNAVTRVPIDPLAYRHLADAAGRLGHDALASDARAKYAALVGTGG